LYDCAAETTQVFGVGQIVHWSMPCHYSQTLHVPAYKSLLIKSYDIFHLYLILTININIYNKMFFQQFFFFISKELNKLKETLQMSQSRSKKPINRKKNNTPRLRNKSSVFLSFGYIAACMGRDHLSSKAEKIVH